MILRNPVLSLFSFEATQIYGWEQTEKLISAVNLLILIGG